MAGYGRNTNVSESTSSPAPALKSSENREEFYRDVRDHSVAFSAILIFRVFHIPHMVQEVRQTIFRHGLAFYGTLAFVAGFLGARLFATLNPRVVVVQNGIHFHHFWYGLIMVIAAGWIGIALSNVWLGRNLAIVFGLGAGLIGDEVGLLLTFGDYTSNLTEIFFVAAIAFIILATLLSKGRKHIERDVINVSWKERGTQVGVFLSAFSALFFASENWEIGLVFISLGILVFLWGLERKRETTSLRSLTS
jgi:hypothetical protein